MKAIRHENLNTPRKPCEPAPDYIFSRCVEHSVITKMGYQSPWALFPMDNVPTYSNMSQMRSYNKEFRNIAMKTRDEFKDKTKCMLPCKYMEYKVNYQYHYSLIFTHDCFQLSEPLIEAYSETILFIKLQSQYIEVLKEEEAYPPLSLVADIGGVLGLFIGFNFMMVWDWIVWGLTNVHQKTSRKKNVHSKDCRNYRK